MASPAGPGDAVSVSNKAAAATPGRGKKRPASPAVSAAIAAVGSKKKKPSPVSGVAAQVTSMDAGVESKVVGTSEITSAEPAQKPLPFKDPNFVHSGIGGAAAGKKNRSWKNLKQIIAAERVLPWKLSDANYYNIDAPPSLQPPKKYSDISGLPANYTDPQTKLRFASSEEFSYIRLLPSDVVTGYLTLRKAACVVP